MKFFPNTNGHFPTINFLRAFVAIFVVLYHFIHFSDYNGNFIQDPSKIKEWSGYLSQTVFIFFVISGFTIPLYLSKINYKIKRIGAFSLNRILRIGIPYWIAILLFIGIEWAFALKNGELYELSGGKLVHHLLFSIQFTEYQWYNPIFWTLAIEMQFYLFIALIHPLLNSKKTWLTWLTMSLFALSTFIFKENNLLFHYAPFFTIGISLFLAFKKRVKVVPILIFIGLNLGIVLWVHGINIFIVTLFCLPFFTNIKIDNPITNFIGNNSYSLYLIHGAIGGSIIYLLGRYIENDLLKYGLIAFSFTLSLLGSYLFYKLIEKPSLRLAKKVQAKH